MGLTGLLAIGFICRDIVWQIVVSIRLEEEK
jgi:hypothetical protein